MMSQLVRLGQSAVYREEYVVTVSLICEGILFQISGNGSTPKRENEHQENVKDVMKTGDVGSVSGGAKSLPPISLTCNVKSGLKEGLLL